ncbi:MAG: molecular chaperone [Beijerinckiaceae bacterium]|nr:molecular chaperone [Beijerinckiaceae bacterium]
MRHRLATTALALCHAALVAQTGVHAAQLRVEPILLEMNSPAAAGTLTLHNGADTEIAVQTRVQRWSQSGGQETLEPTSDVVASPPAVTLAPGADYVIRIVRVTKAAVQREESYRVIVDQLPDQRRRPAQAVNLLIRQSIPVFFRDPRITASKVTWSVRRQGQAVALAAENSGDERVRIAALNLKDASGRTLSFGKGLIGYVLGRSAMSWPLPQAAGLTLKGPISISAETDKGPLRAVSQ